MNRNYIREHDFSPPQPMARAQKLALAVIAVFLLFCLGMAAANAQTCTAGGSTTCFTASKTTGESPIATTLTWNVVGASACTAGGAGSVAAWSGSVPASGTRNLSGIGVKMTLTLDCTAPAPSGKMRLTWTPPTHNTDGSTLTNLGGYYIDYGTAAGALNQTINLAVPGASSYDVTGLSAGTWFAAVKAATIGCFPSTTATCYVSQPSNVASKAVTTTPGGALPQLSVVLEPFQVPKPPTSLTATEAIAFEIRTDSKGQLLAQRIGVLRPGTVCASEGQQTVDGVVYSLVDRAAVDVVNFSNGSDAWVPTVWAKCG